MERQNKFILWLAAMFKEFVAETAKRPLYEVVDLYECQKTGFTRIVICLGGRHTIEKNISDVIIDNELIEYLDKKTVRTLTYLATLEKMKPDYSVVVQKLGDEVDDYILEIKSRNKRTVLQTSPTDLIKNHELLSKFSPLDANRIGYLAGVKETVKEYALKAKDIE